ncbi:MAG: VCBS repeat-containing protein [Planctomycetaceae bacterium]|nr:VCBS repeat-containing protein [Planctomycetaceae bacterium]
MTFRLRIALSITVLLSVSRPTLAKDFPKFERIEIDPHAGEIVYAVTHADVDGDGKDDIVAVTENAVYWYAAPDWKKHTIIKDQTVRDNVCIAAHDIDGDDKVDFALGAGWPQAGGTIQWLSRKDSLDEPWNVHFIGEIPWTHRMRWGDVLGTGTPQLTVSPLNKTEGDGVKLTAFEIPADPKKDRWKATVIADSLNRVHNHWHPALVEGGIVVTFTASQEGLHMLSPIPRSLFDKYRLSSGASGEKETQQGTGEIKGGDVLFGERPVRFLYAAIEPMHGNNVVAYLTVGGGPEVRRHVLDDTLSRGHAIGIADFDGDRYPEIVAGHSDPASGEIQGPGVYVYQADDDTGEKWTKHVIDDGGVAVEDAFAVDLTGDEKPDIVAGGRNTHNVVLYVNQGP